MTPLKIEMMLHFGCHAGPWGRLEAPACIEAINDFRRDGLIDTSKSLHEIVLTDRGRAYIEFLQKVPLPVAHWTLPGLSMLQRLDEPQTEGRP